MYQSFSFYSFFEQKYQKINFTCALKLKIYSIFLSMNKNLSFYKMIPACWKDLVVVWVYGLNLFYDTMQIFIEFAHGGEDVVGCGDG